MWIARSTNEQHQTAACRPGAHGGPKDSARGNSGAQEFGLKKFGNQVGDGHWSPSQEAVHIFLAQLAKSASGLKHGPEIAAARIVDVGRRKLKCVTDHAANFFQRLLKQRISFRIVRRELDD